MSFFQKHLYWFIPVIVFASVACSGTNSNPKKTASTKSTPPTKKEKPTSQPSKTTPKPSLSKEGVSINFQTSTTKKGENTCADVVVQQFTDVVSMQYSINWNPKELNYTAVQGFNLKDLSKNNFGTPKIKEGKLTFSWYDQAIKGVTVPDGTAIYQICFDAIGEKGKKAKLQITEDPIIVEITGKGSKFLQLYTETAYLKIK